MSGAMDCNRDCGARIVLAKRRDNNKWVPYEAEPSTGDAMAGCHVLIDTRGGYVAWRPPALAEHWQVAYELPSLEQARELVNEYPHHRPHLCMLMEGERS